MCETLKWWKQHKKQQTVSNIAWLITGYYLQMIDLPAILVAINGEDVYSIYLDTTIVDHDKRLKLK